ncbi:MAG: leucine-rich repeat domain-containing protein, partial [Clostridia bacterium]|nr:leucine-rich repeat domain-containing protein [Clostridia bacterium]
MTKVLSILMTMCFVITLFSCMSGLTAYAFDNTPAEETTGDFTASSAVSSKSTTSDAKNAELSGSCGDNLTWNYDEATATLTISGTGEMYDCSDSYNGTLYVTNAPWNEYYSTMKTLVINSGVTSIGYKAFRGCTGLTSVTIPDSVTNIDWEAFRDCTGLTSISIPDSVTSIGESAFRDCTGLTSVTIPDGVTSIGWDAFRDC